ncbi:uncharacterized protein LOC129942637 [Eupeodes corollae]|uniref:uncharacterized protein LOC129942637 n=1 Tax=Eupeodes corollae TaxID=290404 RepID=UPI0024936D53|nr:uncharacterized protein LOC129942637 [Eupeodes corollae]
MNTLPKIKWKSKHKSEYQLRLNNALICQRTYDLPQIEEIIKASYYTVNTNTQRNSSAPWYDADCKKYRKLSFGWLRAYRTSNEDYFRHQYLMANKAYKEICNKKKAVFYEAESRRLALCKNSKDFWNLARQLNGKRFSIQTNLSPNLLAAHFEKLLNPVHETPSVEYAIPAYECGVLDATISYQEVISAVTKLKDGKAAGSNGISAEFYKYGTPELLTRLTFIFNNIMETGTIPNEFKESIIFPIHKKGNMAEPANYRGISFLNASYKIFTLILQKRFNEWIDSDKLLQEYQAGFRSGYSTIDHIFTLRCMAETFLRKKKKLYAFFVDFRAAFDMIDRKALFYKLYSKGMSCKFGRVIQNLYDDTTSKVWNGEALSEEFKTQSGVRQGCTLSPSMFALFIDDLVDILPCGVEYVGMIIKLLMFADDIVLLAASSESLQLMINRLFEYCRVWNLIVNLDKSKILIFKSGRGRKCANEKWHYNGENIEVVTEFKYLGVIFTQNLSMEKHLKEKLMKAKCAISATWNRCFHNKSIAHSSKFKLFEAISASILFYAAQTWGTRQYDTVENLLRYYCKRIFQLPRSTPNYVIMLETGISPLFIRTLKMQVDYVTKVLKMDDNRLPKIVALEVIRTKTSWCADWLELASECGIVLNLCSEELETSLYQLIAAVDLKHRDKYINEATGSIYRQLYSQLNHNLEEKNYFRDDNSTAEISMMVKLRSELMPLNYIPHRDDLPIVCSLCNLGEREDNFHFMGCAIWRHLNRRQLLDFSQHATLWRGYCARESPIKFAHSGGDSREFTENACEKMKYDKDKSCKTELLTLRGHWTGVTPKHGPCNGYLRSALAIFLE